VLRERANDIDAFVAMNHYYADFMAGYLDVPRSRIHVIPHGLNLAGHGTRRKDAETFTIGYLARICHDKGLHQLIAAAELLLDDASTPPFRIRAAGYVSKADRHYLRALEQRVESWGRPGVFEYLGELTRAEKIEFLQGLNVLSLPTVYRESKGLPVLEAWANGVGVLLPEHGAFPEMVRHTGGGLLHAPLDPASLAERLRYLLERPQEAAEQGARARAVVHRDHTAAGMAERTLALYRQVRSGALS